MREPSEALRLLTLSTRQNNSAKAYQLLGAVPRQAQRRVPRPSSSTTKASCLHPVCLFAGLNKCTVLRHVEIPVQYSASARTTGLRGEEHRSRRHRTSCSKFMYREAAFIHVKLYIKACPPSGLTIRTHTPCAHRTQLTAVNTGSARIKQRISSDKMLLPSNPFMFMCRLYVPLQRCRCLVPRALRVHSRKYLVQARARLAISIILPEIKTSSKPLSYIMHKRPYLHVCFEVGCIYPNTVSWLVRKTGST
jgi:hypothetical protein